MFATEDIGPFVNISGEKPLFTFQNVNGMVFTSERHIIQTFARLVVAKQCDLKFGDELAQLEPRVENEKTKEYAAELSEQGFPPHVANRLPRVYHKFMKNCFGIPGVTVLPMIATAISHSCKPNATWEYCVAENRVRICTLRNIAKGEEITIDYVENNRELLGASQAQKKAYIERTREFVCTCPLCKEV
jgi:hypothetical protein